MTALPDLADAAQPLEPLTASSPPRALPGARVPVTCATPAAVVGDPCAAMNAFVAVTETTGRPGARPVNRTDNRTVNRTVNRREATCPNC